MLKKEVFFTTDGWLRLRWWPVAFVAGAGATYAGINLFAFAAVASGAPGVADPFWHAPLIWLFGG